MKNTKKTMTNIDKEKQSKAKKNNQKQSKTMNVKNETLKNEKQMKIKKNKKKQRKAKKKNKENITLLSMSVWGGLPPAPEPPRRGELRPAPESPLPTVHSFQCLGVFASFLVVCLSAFCLFAACVLLLGFVWFFMLCYFLLFFLCT